jgi:uncharacterized protein YciI
VTGFIRYRIAVNTIVVLIGVASVGAQAQQPRDQRVYVAWYERGPAWITGKSVRDFPNFNQHLAHLRAIESNLLGAGPFAGDQTAVGMILFTAATDEDAQRLAESDPFVVAHYTRVTTILRWKIDKLKGWP